MGRRHEIRVRYGETDQMAVVHHSVYALYFEEGRTALMRDLGIPYSKMEREGVLLPLLEWNVRFIRAPRYEEVLSLESRLTRLSRVRLRIDYRLYRKEGDVLLAEGHTEHCSVGMDFKPRRMPAHIHAAFASALEPAEEATVPPRQR